MELFYSSDIEGDIVRLGSEESAHCTRVLRHRPGDEVYIIDGEGTLLRCRLESAATALVLERTPGWGSHPYNLTIACCPTKNNERYEWFVEKAVEVGVDRIVPVIGEHSERKVYKTDRARRIAISAAKQSLKAAVPLIDEPLSVREFVAGGEPVAPGEPSTPYLGSTGATGSAAQATAGSAAPLRLIACCFEGEVPRTSIVDALRDYNGTEVVVLIGPEGDFSPAEVSAAVAAGYIPISLGPSRLRTETAALTAAEAVYLHYL